MTKSIVNRSNLFQLSDFEKTKDHRNHILFAIQIFSGKLVKCTVCVKDYKTECYFQINSLLQYILKYHINYILN